MIYTHAINKGERGVRKPAGRDASQDRHVGQSHRIAVTHLSGCHGRPNAAASGGIRVLKEEAEKLEDLSNLPKSSYPQNVAQFLGNKLPKNSISNVNSGGVDGTRMSLQKPLNASVWEATRRDIPPQLPHSQNLFCAMRGRVY